MAARRTTSNVEWQQHPNAGRVRRWAEVHQHMRSEIHSIGGQLTDILNLRCTLHGAKEPQPETAASLVAKLTLFHARLQRFSEFLESHAEFEESTLFPSLLAGAPELEKAMLALESDHERLHSVESALLHATKVLLSVLTDSAAESVDGAVAAAAASSAAVVERRFAEYVDEIHSHLAHEEGELLPVWLGLSIPGYRRFIERMDGGGHGDTVSTAAAEAAAAEAAKANRRLERFSSELRGQLRVLLERHELSLEDLQAAQPSLAALISEAVSRVARAPPPKPVAAVPPPAAAAAASSKPVLRDRHGKVVNMDGGCCFDGVDTCCKGSAYARLMRAHKGA
eukprot:c8415_g1_i1.p1 GENE.c8415_g1_i1~~c8415_g1_i1.p1  ORF type:complete len:339 (+),score=62.67 c8415_g1_i1:947-1963(+)